MFDLSFSELAVCLVVALVVLGPERLPKVARTVGRWTGTARAYMRNLTAELERESQVAEIKKQINDAQQAMRESENQIRKAVTETGNELKQVANSATDVGSPGSTAQEKAPEAKSGDLDKS